MYISLRKSTESVKTMLKPEKQKILTTVSLLYSQVKNFFFPIIGGTTLCRKRGRVCRSGRELSKSGFGRCAPQPIKQGGDGRGERGECF